MNKILYNELPKNASMDVFDENKGDMDIKFQLMVELKTIKMLGKKRFFILEPNVKSKENIKRI